MRWLRSWPACPPPGRAHVVDRMERLVIEVYDYSPLGQVADDVIVVEWDIAVDLPSARAFEHACWQTPGQVRVAPYLLHDGLGDRWAHRIAPDASASSERWVVQGDLFCDLFGFGLVYLPWRWVEAFLASPAPERGRPPWAAHYEDCRLTDQTFSTWLRFRTDHGPVPIEWPVRPTHLHGAWG